VRRAPRRPGEIMWDPSRGELDLRGAGNIDAIINFSGENIAAGRWTRERCRRIESSRIDATRTLVAAMARLEVKPKVLVNASAVGAYGDRGAETVDETSGLAGGFLPTVVRKWEDEALRARELGVRVATLRFGVVLSPADGALAKMLPVFRAGLGGRVGSGQQWLSWIGIDDALGAVLHAVADARVAGPVNVVSPEPVTNAEFAATLGRVLRRPALCPVPAWVLRGIFGEMAEATLLCSTRAVPTRLSESGFVFRHPGLETALRHSLGVAG